MEKEKSDSSKKDAIPGKTKPTRPKFPFRIQDIPAQSAPSQLPTRTASSNQTQQPPTVAEHAYLTDVANVRQMEQGLMQLLDDFHLGKLQAFGEDCSQKKMDEVRERQERLARLHFEFDSNQDSAGITQASASQNMSTLLEKLDDLCYSIHNLQPEEDKNNDAPKKEK